MIYNNEQNNTTKNTAFGDILRWHLATVCINIDRERAAPSKRHTQFTKFYGANQ